MVTFPKKNEANSASGATFSPHKKSGTFGAKDDLKDVACYKMSQNRHHANKCPKIKAKDMRGHLKYEKWKRGTLRKTLKSIHIFLMKVLRSIFDIPSRNFATLILYITTHKHIKLYTICRVIAYNIQHGIVERSMKEVMIHLRALVYENRIVVDTIDQIDLSPCILSKYDYDFPPQR